MRSESVHCIALTAILLMASPGCRRPSDNSPATNGPSAPASPNPAPGAVEPGPLTPAADTGEALILRAEKEVLIKLKGAQEFIPILRSMPFRSGDTLRIGADSRAVVFCKDVCELFTGTYTDCCTDSCKVRVRMGRRGGTDTAPNQYIMLKKDLPQAEAAAFADSESRLRELYLGETTTQFLKTSLYSSWKLKEAEDELNRLSSELDKPQAREELGRIYTSVTRRTGDMFVMINQKDKAVYHYQKAVQPPPQAADTQWVDLEEKALSHARLAELHAKTGRKVEAEENLKAAKRIYVRQGDTKKAAALDKRFKAKNQ